MFDNPPGRRSVSTTTFIRGPEGGAYTVPPSAPPRDSHPTDPSDASGGGAPGHAVTGQPAAFAPVGCGGAARPATNALCPMG